MARRLVPIEPSLEQPGNAFAETLGKGAQTESIAKNVEASNLWAFFQAKTIRRTVVQTAAEQAKLVAACPDGKLASGTRPGSRILTGGRSRGAKAFRPLTSATVLPAVIRQR